MISFKKYLQKNKKKYSISEDAILNDDEAAPAGDVSAPSSSPAPDLGIQTKPDGALSDNEVLGNCDHMHGDGFMKDGCFHIPMRMPLYGRIPNRKKKKIKYATYDDLDESKKIDVSKDDYDNLKTSETVIVTRPVDQLVDFNVGDIVELPYNMEYKVVTKKDITDITEHPFYDELTSVQLGEISRYANGKLAVM